MYRPGEGGVGSVSVQENHRAIDDLAGNLQRETRRDPRTLQDVPVARVEVAQKVDLPDRLGRGGVDVVVFNSQSEIAFARELNARHRQVQMVVLTGLVPDGEIVILPKSCLSQARAIILDL